MKKFSTIFVGISLVALIGCDLQPKIMSLPDSVGDFISTRYPALLADPDTQPEIYNSAATDYGVYASPELYGGDTDDYVLYASVDDYIIPPQQSESVVAAPVSDGVDSGGEIVVEDAEYEIITSASIDDDYLSVPMYGTTTTQIENNVITVARGDTLYALARAHNLTVEELASANNLSTPYTLKIGQKLNVPTRKDVVVSEPINVPARKTVTATTSGTASVAQHAQTTTRVKVKEISVAPGDTLYSLSRKYSTPVNDLAVMNNLTAPFTLSVGQKIKVPDLENAPVRAAATSVAKTTSSNTKPATNATHVSNGAGKGATNPATKSTNKPTTKTAAKTETKPTTKNTTKSASAPKISSDPSKKLPTISARSSSKFSWPVRGKILSKYGAKSGGLFNDGINISASRGTAVKAAENGVVAYAGNEVKGMGNLVIIQHSGGWMTVYAHMDSMSVRRGARVNVGQKIGTVGSTGKVDQPQLHFEIRKGTKAYNPSAYLKQ